MITFDICTLQNQNIVNILYIKFLMCFERLKINTKIIEKLKK